MAGNLFDSIDGTAAGEAGAAPWAARSPFRPEAGRDLMLVPRVRATGPPTPRARRRSSGSPPTPPSPRSASTPAASTSASTTSGSRRAASRSSRGAAAADANADLAAGERYAVYFWGANTTKALHIGHLRNLALGNALAAALRIGGARVENRSLICDVGRSMGEAMAGIVASGPRRRRARLRGRREVRPLRRPLLRRVRHAPAARPRATTAPRTRSPASRRSTTTRPTN